MTIVNSGNGLMTINWKQTDILANTGLPARKIYEVRENVPLEEVVKNLSKRPVAYTKNILIAVGPELAETIFAFDELTLSSKNLDEVTNKESDNGWTTTERHQQVAAEDEKREMHSWRQEKQIEDNFPTNSTINI